MQQILQKITAAFLSLLTVLGLWAAPQRPVTDDPELVSIPQPDYAALAAEEADWLWKQQLPNGAIAFYYRDNGEVTVNPYFSSFAAMALTAYDGSAEAGERIKRFIEWYFAHLNTAKDNIIPGTIYDYTITIKNGEIVSEESTGKYDSTDSYSAFFLCLLWDYAGRYGDITLLREHAAEIRTLLNVIYATRVYGYTFAKPSDLHLYLMDNCEVYSGVCAAEKISAAVTVDGENAFISFFTRIGIWFNNLISKIKALF